MYGMPSPSASQAAVSGSSAPISAMYASEEGSTGSPSMRVFQGLSGGKMEAFGGGGGGPASGAGGGLPGPARGRRRVPASGFPAVVPASGPAPPASRPAPASGRGARAWRPWRSVIETPPLHATRPMSRALISGPHGRGTLPSGARRKPSSGYRPGRCLTPGIDAGSSAARRATARVNEGTCWASRPASARSTPREPRGPGAADERLHEARAHRAIEAPPSRRGGERDRRAAHPPRSAPAPRARRTSG